MICLNHYDCLPLSAQVQNEIDALTELDQLLYAAAEEEYAKVQEPGNAPVDLT